MIDQDRHNLFSELIARHQSDIYAYIFAILRNWEDSDDLFQSVCLALWRKFEQFEPGTSFMAWARQTAKFEVRRFFRAKQSPSFANEDLLEELVETTCERGDRGLPALERCREKLNASDEALLELHYSRDLSSSQIADKLQRSQASVCHSLTRIRRALFDCVRKELAQEDHAGRELA